MSYWCFFWKNTHTYSDASERFCIVRISWWWLTSFARCWPKAPRRSKRAMWRWTILLLLYNHVAMVTPIAEVWEHPKGHSAGCDRCHIRISDARDQVQAALDASTNDQLYPWYSHLVWDSNSILIGMYIHNPGFLMIRAKIRWEGWSAAVRGPGKRLIQS